MTPYEAAEALLREAGPNPGRQTLDQALTLLEPDPSLEAFALEVDINLACVQQLLSERAFDPAAERLRLLVVKSGFYQDQPDDGWLATGIAAVRLLAIVEAERGRPEAAEAILRRMVGHLEGEDPANLAVPLMDLGMLLSRTGRVSEGAQHIERAIDGFDRIPELDSETFLATVLASIPFLLEANRIEAAEKLAHRAVALASSEGGEESLPYGEALSQLAHVQLMKGSSREAEELLETAFSIFSREPDAMARPGAGQMAEALGQISVRNQQWEMGASWLKEAIAQWERAETAGLPTRDLTLLRTQLEQLEQRGGAPN